MATDDTQPGLPRSGFFEAASAELSHTLDRLSSEVRLSAGEVLFDQGDRGDALFAVVEGALEISVLSEDGRKLALDVINAGSLLGEIALFDPGERTATATALGDCVLLRLRNADLLAEIERDPKLAVAMIRLAGQRMRAMNAQLSDQVFLPMPVRLARKILYLLGVAGTGDTLRMSQSALADFMGTTREAVSKTISDWKRQGIVKPGRGGLTVRDRAALGSLADLDPH